VTGSPLTALLVAAIVVAVGAAVFAWRRGTQGGAGAVTARMGRSIRGRRPELSGGPLLERALADMPPGFLQASGVSTPAGPIPAVVVGPTGVWAVAGSKARGVIGVLDGAVTVGGQPTELASELWRRAHALADGLAPAAGGEIPPVQAALVFLEEGAKLVKTEAMGVRLLEARQVAGAIAGSRARLDEAAVRRLREAMTHLC
jgi:hypothetical protein